MTQLQYKTPIYEDSHFTWHEALYMPKVDAYAILTEPLKQNIITMARTMDLIRNHYNEWVKINSWVRTPEYNKMIGGSPKSYHIQGIAVDFTVNNIAVSAVHRDLREGRIKDVHVRWEADAPTWVHIDLGGVGPFNGYPMRKTR